MLLLALLLGCRSTQTAKRRTGDVGEVGDAAIAWPRGQYLYRLRGRWQGESLRLRVALRVAGEGDFEVEVLDPLGRRSWWLRQLGARVLLLDYREDVGCWLRAEDPLPGDWPLPLRSASLPALLLGRLPSEIVGAAPGGLRARSQEDSLVVQRAMDGRIEAWAGEDAQGRWMTWRREADEAVLEAASLELELRWRLVADEALAEDLERPSLPKGFEVRSCMPDR